LLLIGQLSNEGRLCDWHENDSTSFANVAVDGRRLKQEVFYDREKLPLESGRSATHY
jgi:hypothetical protein